MGPLTLSRGRPAQPNFPFKDEKGDIGEKLEFSLFFSPTDAPQRDRESGGGGRRRGGGRKGRKKRRKCRKQKFRDYFIEADGCR